MVTPVQRYYKWAWSKKHIVGTQTIVSGDQTRVRVLLIRRKRRKSRITR